MVPCATWLQKVYMCVYAHEGLFVWEKWFEVR